MRVGISVVCVALVHRRIVGATHIHPCCQVLQLLPSLPSGAIFPQVRPHHLWREGRRAPLFDTSLPSGLSTDRSEATLRVDAT